MKQIVRDKVRSSPALISSRKASKKPNVVYLVLQKPRVSQIEFLLHADKVICYSF